MTTPPTNPTTQPTLEERYAAALDALRPKIRRFVEEYLVDLNATQAALRAGYAKASAASQASELRRNPKVAEAITLGLELQAMGPREVIARVSQIAQGSLAPFLDIDQRGELVGFRFGEDVPLHLLKKASVTEKTYKVNREDVLERTVTIELYDRQRALETMARHHGLLIERHEHSGPNGGPVEVVALTPEQRAARVAELLARGQQRAQEGQGGPA